MDLEARNARPAARTVARVRNAPASPRPSSFALLACAALALGFAAACGHRPTSVAQGRGVLVIAIDSLRADHVSGLGYDRRTTPNLDEFAKEGVSFSSAWSASPDLLPAHVALLTGCDPRLARRPDLVVKGRESELASWYVTDGLPRLAQQFLAHGYETAAFLDHPAISQVHGFARGFQVFSGYQEERPGVPAYVGFEGVGSKFTNWLGSLPQQQDWFAYLQVDDLEQVWSRPEADPKWDTFFDARPELSQVPPVAEGDDAFFAVPRRRWSGGTLSMGEYEARYDGAIRQLDRGLARLFDNLARRGHLENTTVVVVGTCGLSLGESGLYLVSGTLSDADLHVPLLVRPSRRVEMERGRLVDGLVSTIDLAPTLLELHAIPVPPGMMGVSQKDLVLGRGAPLREHVFASGGLQGGTAAIDRRFCFESGFPGRRWDERVVRSWYGDSNVHAVEEREFLHDRSADPTLGHLEGPADDDAARTRLRDAAASWYGWIDAARAVLHRPSAARDEPARKLHAELVQRGMLPREN